MFSVQLAIQQAKVIEKHTDLKVKHYVGEMKVDDWDKPTWEKEFHERNVLVMTADIFSKLLRHRHICLDEVNLLIFDECHSAKSKKNNHPYNQIMENFMRYPIEAHPKVMGLTASVLNRKVKLSKIESEIKELQENLRSTCETSHNEDVEKFAAKPKEEVLTFSNQAIDKDTDKLIAILTEVLKEGFDLLFAYPKLRGDVLLEKAQSAFRDCQDILQELGPWAACKVAGYLIEDLGKVCVGFWGCPTSFIVPFHKVSIDFGSLPCRLKSGALETLLPLGISNNLLLGGYEYLFFWHHLLMRNETT